MSHALTATQAGLDVLRGVDVESDAGESRDALPASSGVATTTPQQRPARCRGPVLTVPAPPRGGGVRALGALAA